MSVINPFSSQHHACRDLIQYVRSETTLKTVSVALSILVASTLVGALSFGLGGVALFRYLVGRVVKQPVQGNVNHIANQTLPTVQKKALDEIFQRVQKRLANHHQLPNLYQFLTKSSYKIDPKNYDLGFEQSFGVCWLDPAHAADRRFLEAMSQKYPAALKKLQDADIDTRNRFSLTDKTRLADNNVFNLLDAIQKKQCSDIQGLVREAMTYCILRNNNAI